MYKSILVPLDGSKRAEQILPHVEELAQCTGAKLVLVSVVIPAYYVLDPHIAYMNINLEETEYRNQEAEDYLDNIRKRLKARGFEVEAHVAQGAIIEGILEMAGKEDVSIIAMASHGRTGLSRVFYGSVAAGILQQVDRPLLLIRSRDED